MNWFTKWLMKENDVEKSSESVVEDVKVPLISEPVLSLIESLKNREWIFEQRNFIRMDLLSYYVRKRGHQLEFAIRKVYEGGDVEFSCDMEWMTSDERKSVAKIAFDILRKEQEEWLVVKNWKEREKFMILTKEKH